MKRLVHMISMFLLYWTWPQMVFAQIPQGVEKMELKPIIGLQMWGSYTFNEKIYNSEKETYEKVDSRMNLLLRRSRFGVKGQFHPNLNFNITAALDLVGKDVLSGIEAGQNNGSSPKFRIWNAYLHWQLKTGNEKFNLIFGYMPLQIGRESITSALRSTSMEKSWSQNYLRRHLTGIGPGRAGGINLGGIFSSKNKKLGLRYDLGIFNPVFENYNGNSVGVAYSPLLVGRFVGMIGDVESNKYSISHKINHLNKRKGISLALAGATQGKTDMFLGNYALGGDFLFNWNHWNMDGEWTWLIRKGMDESNDINPQTFYVRNSAAYLRLSYNIPVDQQFILEPLIMWSQFNGGMKAGDQMHAEFVKSLAGKDQTIDAGLNFYINPNLKLSLHYTLRDGDAGAAGKGATLNNYLFQSTVGAIQKGDWLGFGIVAVL